MTRILVSIITVFFAFNIHAAMIATVFGDIQEENPAILDLINSQAMQRLKQIDQSGPPAYFVKDYPKFSRYDHSLGVYALLKRYNTPLKEQIAGLTHDASHTAFSHLADIIFQSGKNRTESYQDTIHPWFLKQMHIDDILASYNLSIDDISPKNPEFTALEQEFPDMNADRIEYNLHTALVFQDLTNDEVTDILAALRFDHGKWYFTNPMLAKKFAKLSTYYNKSIWGSAHNNALYAVTGATLKYALQQQIITNDELHFGNDGQILKALSASKDPYLRTLLRIIDNIDNHYEIATDNKPDIFVPVKMRGIDPLVAVDGKLQRLSDIYLDYKNELIATRKYASQGVAIKFINIKDTFVLNLLRQSNV